ncbi:MAG: hypothetical protein KAV82_01655 [Phycisphaerae bacterium]|nr:hypothetical protein [Phycisphaerae bacterium]
MAVSRQCADVFWSHNDDTDDTRVFAFQLDGALVAVYTLVGDGVLSIDTEDIALGPGPEAGVDYLFLADIGDNHSERSCIKVYRVPEPSVGSPADPIIDTLGGVDVITLQYPDGPWNAETLLVDPLTGDIYVVTKSGSALGRVYHAPYPHSTAGTILLEFKAELPWGSLSGVNGATGGDVSADGSLVIVRRYSSANPPATLWIRPPGTELWEVFEEDGCEVPLLYEPQGEAVCFQADGMGYYTLSEGIHTPIYRFRMNVQCASDIQCEDGNICTDDFCVEGMCVHEDNADFCDDSDFCTIDDSCVGGVCRGVPVTCLPDQLCNPGNGECEPMNIVVVFQEELDGYFGTKDTFIDQAKPWCSYGKALSLEWAEVDDLSGSDDFRASLIGFDDIFGDDFAKVPFDAPVVSATLSYTVSDQGNNGVIHEMNWGWEETVRFCDLAGRSGIDSDIYGMMVGELNGGADTGVLDVTASVRKWARSLDRNQGWIILPTDSDGVQVASSEAQQLLARPKLTIKYSNLVRLGDGNYDGDIDIGDYALLTRCLEGPAATPVISWPADFNDCLRVFDADHDGDIDLVDFAGFQQAFIIGTD